MSHLDDDPEAAAKKHGQVCVYPGAHELFVDIDCQEDRDWLDEQLAVLSKMNFELEVVREIPSKSGGARCHVYLHSPRELSNMDRIALQACLGSDRRRELLSIMRTFLKVGRAPTIFFEKPENAPSPVVIAPPKSTKEPEFDF